MPGKALTEHPAFAALFRSDSATLRDDLDPHLLDQLDQRVREFDKGYTPTGNARFDAHLETLLGILATSPAWKPNDSHYFTTLLEQFLRFLYDRFDAQANLYNLYGSTEVSWVSIATPEDLRVAPGTAGRLPVGTRLAILDEHDRPVPPGTDGRIFVGNAMPFDGYTGAAADVERHRGLLGTGDLGHVDDDGRLHVTGRADDMIISGGENVHPGPVETLLAARPEVREVAVVGVDDEQYGQRLAAYVVPGPGAVVGPEEVRGWVRAALGSFSVPRDVVFLDELPRNATGKVARKNLPRH